MRRHDYTEHENNVLTILDDSGPSVTRLWMDDIPPMPTQKQRMPSGGCSGPALHTFLLTTHPPLQGTHKAFCDQSYRGLDTGQAAFGCRDSCSRLPSSIFILKK